jgi:hypothetical protein
MCLHPKGGVAGRNPTVIRPRSILKRVRWSFLDITTTRGAIDSRTFLVPTLATGAEPEFKRKPEHAVDINRELIVAGVTVSELRPFERSLEEVFFQLTGERQGS